eukprot:g12246.t1
MAKGQHGREEETERDGIYDSSSDDDDNSSSSRSSSGSDASTASSSGGSSSSDSSSSENGSGSESDDSDSDGFGGLSEDENFELSFWESLKAAMPWTQAGKEADYAEERLDAHEEFQEELDEALRIRKMVETGLHDTALERLMASTEGQMYHHFHKHRYVLEQSGEWCFVPPSVKRRWRIADKKTDKVEKLRKYMAMRRDRFLRIRGLCRQIRSAHGKSSDLVVTILPESLIDENLLSLASGAKKHKPTATFGGSRLKKCHWQGTNSKGEHCTCTNYRMEHPHRVFKDEFGVLVHDTLATCGWHATRCVSNTHGDDPAVISTANEGALCNECLVQLTKGPIRNTTAFGAPGVRFKNKRAGTADTDAGGGGEEFLAWNKWFTKGPGRARKRALRPRHPQAPPGLPPAGLRPPAEYVPPPPPPPVFSMANWRRQKKLAKWRMAAFRNVNATSIQRMIRGMQARALFRRVRARALVQRQMLFFITRAFVASAKVARRIREEMRKKHAIALSFQRAWRGKKGREKAAVLRAVVLRRHGAAITTQKAWRCCLARRELRVRRIAHLRQIRGAIVLQSFMRMRMENFLRETGYPLQKEEATLIVKRFFDGDGFCLWHSFLNSYHHAGSEGTACTRHGRLLCTLCIRHGRCEKPGCACTKAKAGRSKQLGFKMCECGHVFDAHALVVGGSKPPKRQRGWVLPQKQLNSLLSKSLSKTAVDRPVNVEGCSAESNLRPPPPSPPPPCTHPETSPDGSNILRRRRQNAPPAVLTDYRGEKLKLSRRRCPHPHPGRSKRRNETRPERDVGEDEERGGVTALSLEELSPPFFGGRDRDRAAAVSPSPFGHDFHHIKNGNVDAMMKEARDSGTERRDASWAGRRGQAERAALAEMTSAVQGRNAADYATRLQDDIATNTSVVDGRLCLAPVMSKTELRKGFAISAAVPFVKAGTLKVTTDPVGLYLYLLKAFSDERHELLEDDRRFTDFVARHAVFLERHWCKLVKDIRNGATDPHLPITEAKRMRLEGLMIPNKKRAQRLDDRLRVLGFHARASGVYKAATTAATSSAAAAAAAAQQAGSKSPGKAGEPETTGVRRRRRKGSPTTSTRPLTQEEQQESMARMVEARKKKRPGTAAGAGGVEPSDRRKRRTVTAGELESTLRLLKSKSRPGSRARSQSTGAVQVMPTGEEASRRAYSLLTAPSAKAAGTVQAPFGRDVYKHVCVHPGCGKVFHLKASATRHQEEHQFRRSLAASTPLVDQHMAPAWPKDGVPWVPGSQSHPQPSGSLTAAAAATTSPHRKRRIDMDGAEGDYPNSSRRRNAGTGTGHRIGSTSTTDDVNGGRDLGQDIAEPDFHSRFACGVPNCRHRFTEARLLALHLRMGHSDFDLDKMKAAREGTAQSYTLDGVPITAPILVGGHVRASFLGAYRLVPPFQSPIGCPSIPACAQHGRLKPGCRCCADIESQAAEAVSIVCGGTRLQLGAPLPPAKFYTRATVVVSHHGRPIKLDLDCANTLRCPLLSFPRLGADGAHAHGSEDLEGHQGLDPCGTKGGHDDDDDVEDSGVKGAEAMGGMRENVGLVGQLKVEGSDCHRRQDGGQNHTSSEAVGVDADGEEADDGDEGVLVSGIDRREGPGSDQTLESGRRPSTGVVGSGSATNTDNGRRRGTAENEVSSDSHSHSHSQSRGRSQPQPHQDTRRQHQGRLVPVQLVAVLVDGSGKGWMAARRLWSVGEVGFEALSAAGLSTGDVDVDQELFVGTEVQYLPLSLVRDTCGVKVDCKADVHSKQRLGDLPKPLRYVSHGVDSATGAVLLESELRRRDERVLGGGSS